MRSNFCNEKKGKSKFKVSSKEEGVIFVCLYKLKII